MHAWGAGQVHDEGLCHQVIYRGDDRARAVRMVASLSADAVECGRVLEQLGLDPGEGVGQREGDQ